MEFRDVVARRRMVRRYRDRPVDPESIERIVGSICRSPSAGNAQGVSVIAVTDAATRSAIAELAGESDYVERGFEAWLSPAPVHLVLCADPGRYRERYAEGDKDASALEVPWWWVDGGAAMMLGALAAVDEGLAAGFLGGHRLGGIHGLLGIPTGVEVLGLLTVGHPAPDRRSSSLRRPQRSDRLHREQWSDTDL
jgi:nitroreductase